MVTKLIKLIKVWLNTIRKALGILVHHFIKVVLLSSLRLYGIDQNQIKSVPLDISKYLSVPTNSDMETLNLCLFLFQAKDSQETRKILRKIWWQQLKKIIIITVAIFLSIIIILLCTNIIPTWPFYSPFPIGTNKVLHVITEFYNQ